MRNNPHREQFLHCKISRNAVVIDPTVDYDPGTHHSISTGSAEAPRACLEKNGVDR